MARGVYTRIHGLLWRSLPPQRLIVTCLSKNFTAFWQPCPVTCFTRIREPPDHHCYLKTPSCHGYDMYSCVPWSWQLLPNLTVSQVSNMFVPLHLITASKLCCVSGLTCILDLSQLDRYLKASPFSSSLTRSQRLRHTVSFASIPTVRKSWCVWEIALIAKCEWSR